MTIFNEKIYSHCMLTIKKIRILVSIFFFSLVFSLTPASTQTAERYGVSVSPLVGILYGQGEEILYKYSNRDQYASQLLWDLKPLVYMGLAVDFGPRNPFHSSGLIAASSIKFGLPFKTGAMEDRDWMNPQHDWLTHYSRHDAYAMNAILADISAGYSWRLSDTIALSAYGEFSFMYLSWSGDNGYAQYPEYDSDDNYPAWSSSFPKKYFSGKSILYTQTWFILSPGVSLKGRINRLFSLQWNINYSPLIYATARDDHLLYPSRTFGDYLFFGHYLKGGGKVIFTPLNNLNLTLSLLYRYITGSRGDSYWKYAGAEVSDIVSKNYDGGAGHSTLEIELAARIYIKAD